MTISAEVRGSGTPVILLHGNPLDHRSMLPLDEAFEAAPGRWRRYYLDLPGFGASPAGPEIDGSLAVADAVSAWIDEEIGAAPFALVGHSFGGLIARELSGRYRAQISGVALVAPVVVEPHMQRNRPAFRVIVRGAGAELDGVPAEERIEFEANSVVQTAEAFAAYRAGILSGIEVHDRAAAARIEANYPLPWLPEQKYGEITAPSLWLLGRADAVVGYADQLTIATHYPSASVALLDGAGHMPQIEAPALTRALVGDWLVRTRRGAA